MVWPLRVVCVPLPCIAVPSVPGCCSRHSSRGCCMFCSRAYSLHRPPPRPPRASLQGIPTSRAGTCVTSDTKVVRPGARRRDALGLAQRLFENTCSSMAALGRLQMNLSRQIHANHVCTTCASDSVNHVWCTRPVTRRAAKAGQHPVSRGRCRHPQQQHTPALRCLLSQPPLSSKSGLGLALRPGPVHGPSAHMRKPELPCGQPCVPPMRAL